MKFDFDCLDYGARFYDPAIGRFFTHDRFAEKYLDFSPYQYGANNPIYFVDVNGDSIVSILRKENLINILNSPVAEGGGNYTNTITLQGVKQSDVSDYSAEVVNDAMNGIGDKNISVSSGKRTSKEQAEIMYKNSEQQGSGSQFALYGPNGDKVIQTYINLKYASFEKVSTPERTAKTLNLSAATIKSAMELQIDNLGPGSVSRHCANDPNMNVFDIAPSSVSNVQSFQNKLSTDNRVFKLIKYPKDPGIHVVIKF